jgi:aspartyl/asparaginyl-tRNA synthetase
MSKVRNHWLGMIFSCATLAALVAYPLATHMAYGEENSHNPHIHAALDALHQAHDEISNAPHDFHGQRKEALEVLDKAIQKLDEIKDY